MIYFCGNYVSKGEFFIGSNQVFPHVYVASGQYIGYVLALGLSSPRIRMMSNVSQNKKIIRNSGRSRQNKNKINIYTESCSILLHDSCLLIHGLRATFPLSNIWVTCATSPIYLK